MENQYLTGFTNCMGLGKNSNVRFVEGQVIGEARHLKNIFSNGDMHME
jgi:hypothetical protein